MCIKARKLDAELRQFHEEAKRKHREDVAYRRDAELQMKTVKFAQQQQQKEELLEQRKQACWEVSIFCIKESNSKSYVHGYQFYEQVFRAI